MEAAVIQDEENDTGHHEGVTYPDDAVAELIGQLDIIAIQPTSLDFGHPVQGSDILRGEDPSDRQIRRISGVLR
jgi:hypothetical protein